MLRLTGDCGDVQQVLHRGRLMLVFAEWLFDCTVQKLVVVITCLETNEVLERWQFDIDCDKTAKDSRYVAMMRDAGRNIFHQIYLQHVSIEMFSVFTFKMVRVAFPVPPRRSL